MLTARDNHDKAISNMTLALMKYEDIGVAYYAFDDPNMRVLTHPSHENLKE